MGEAVGQIEPQRLQGWWRGDPALNTAEVAPWNGAIADWRYGERVVSMLQKNETMCSIQASQFSTASPGDTFEFPGITRRKHQPERAGVPYYPQIVCANPLASGFQFGAQVAVLNVDGHIQGQYRERAQQAFDFRLQLRGPLLGAPVAQFRRDDGTGEDHLWAYSMWRTAGPLGSRSSALIAGVQPITVHRTSSDLSGASATSGNWSSAPSGSSCRHLANNSAMSRGPITSSIKRDWSGMVVVYRRPQTLQPTFAVD